MDSVCVFCGSRNGKDPVFEAIAIEVGRVLAESGRRLVFGGGDVGLMGAAASSAHTAGGAVIGVIPEALIARELTHPPEVELRVVATMHERKALMVDLADGFLVLPGGFGTLDELFEIITWSQLGIHRKAVGLLNVEGFYDDLLGFLDRVVDAGFLLRCHRELLIVDDDPASILDRLARWTPPPSERWAEVDDI